MSCAFYLNHTTAVSSCQDGIQLTEHDNPTLSTKVANLHINELEDSVVLSTTLEIDPIQ